MDGGSECLCIHSMMYLATGFAAESRDAGLVRAGPFRGSIAVRNWSKAAVVSRAVQAILMAASSACLIYSLCCRAENSELARCKGKASTVVDAMWGAGSEESAERLEMACESRIITSTRTITP
jgi:hypothetical protein